jgi:hypothetical protein
MRFRSLYLSALLVGAGLHPGAAATFTMDQLLDVTVPSSRGSANTTWFGWEAFNESNTRNVPIDDSTPDLGTTASGARFRTTNGEDHVISSGNLYFFTTGQSLAEEITVPTSGTVGTGFTTIILQAVTAPGFGSFPAPITLNAINGVTPTIVQGSNAAGLGQFWAVWTVPGNQAGYTITLTGPANQQHYSFDRVVVDTFWSASLPTVDSMAQFTPAITTASPLYAALGIATAIPLSASGGTAPFVWSLGGGTLPDGLSLSTEGVLSGTPGTVGMQSCVVQITDSQGRTATKSFDISVTTAPSVVTTSPLNAALTGVPLELTLQAEGGSAPYTWSVTSGTLPGGLTLNAQGALSGTPVEPGTFTFTAQAADSHGFTASKVFQIRMVELQISTASLPAAVKGIAYSHTLAGAGGTLPYAWTLSGGALPPGVQLGATGIITGVPTASGLYTATAQLSDGEGFTVSRNLDLTVHASYVKPVVNAPVFEVATVGVPVAYTVTALNYPKTFTITGLPAGVTARPAGLISGRPSVSGVFLVKIKAANPAGSSTVLTVPMVVRALPNGLVGTFTGIINRDATANGGLGSRLSLTTAVNGFYTAQVTTGALTRRATGWLSATAPQVGITVGTATLSLTLDKDSQLVSGTHGTATVSGWRSTWNATSNPATHRIGYYSAALALADTADIGSPAIPQGHGFATFSVASSGALTVAGKTADNQTITSAGFIGPNGEIAVYTPLYGSQGSVLGQWTLSEEAGGQFAGNSVSGALTWRRPVTAGYTYAAGFGPVNVAVAGKYLAPNAKGEVLGLPEAGTADVLFEQGGVDLSATEANVTGFTYTDENKVIVPAAGGVNNAARATLAVNKSTGAVSGTITLVEGSPALKRTVSFYGQTVRLADPEVKAVGWFLLPQIPGQGQTLKTSPVLSGSFLIKQ